MRFAVLLFSFLLPAASLADDVEGLSGDWVHAGDPYGFVIGHVEHLSIASDGALEVTVWESRTSGHMCREEGAEGPFCSPPVLAERGVLRVEPVARVLRVVDVETLAPAFASPREHWGWDVIRITADAAWVWQRDGDRLELARIAAFDGNLFSLRRVYHRVSPDFPGQFYAYLVATERGIAMAGCALSPVQDDPDLRPAFAQLVADLHPVTDALMRLESEGTPEARARIDLIRKGAGPVDGIDEQALAAFRGAWAWTTETSDWNHALLPGAERHLESVLACHEAYHEM